MNFYVTMLRGERHAWLAGPFADKAAAEAKVEAAREAACAVDPWAAFDAFGVSAASFDKAGVLNARLGL